MLMPLELFTFPLSLVMFRVAERDPEAVGAKAKLNMQVLPGPGAGGIVAPVMHVLPVVTKSPGFELKDEKDTLERVNVPLPVFVSVTTCAGALVVPTACELKFTKVVESDKCGVKTPFPVTVMFWVPPALAPKVSVVVRAPEAPGVNVTTTAHVPPEPITCAPLVHVVPLAPLTIAKSPEFPPLRLGGVVIVI